MGDEKALLSKEQGSTPSLIYNTFIYRIESFHYRVPQNPNGLATWVSVGEAKSQPATVFP